MNLGKKKRNVVTANVDKPLSFPSRWSLQLKVCEVSSPGIPHYVSSNQFCSSVFFLFSSAAPRLAGGGLVHHSLPGAETKASMITVNALLF